MYELAPSRPFEEALTSELLRRVDHTGGLLRKEPGTDQAPHLFPLKTVRPEWWRWRVVVSTQWSKALRQEHINRLELRSVLSAVRWRARSVVRQGKRFFHFSDSMVAIGCLNKARSSSHDLTYIVDKVTATLLAARCRMILAHVDTKLNPADAPSRGRLVKKKPTLRPKGYRRSVRPERLRKQAGLAGADPAGSP
jgi:hypothetical protein